MHGHELPRQASWDRLNPNKPRNTGSYSAQGEADGIIRPAEAVGTYRSQLVNSFSGKILRMDADSGDGREPQSGERGAGHSVRRRRWLAPVRRPGTQYGLHG